MSPFNIESIPRLRFDLRQPDSGNLANMLSWWAVALGCATSCILSESPVGWASAAVCRRLPDGSPTSQSWVFAN